MNLKKMGKYLRVNLLGPGPRLMKKEFTRPRPGTGPWHQLYRAARDYPRIDN